MSFSEKEEKKKLAKKKKGESEKTDEEVPAQGLPQDEKKLYIVVGCAGLLVLVLGCMACGKGR